MSKELYIAAHEELVSEEMDRTGCDWTEAYDRTADAAYDRMRDRMADMADHYRQLKKDGEI
jgi:hypothetical protein